MKMAKSKFSKFLTSTLLSLSISTASFSQGDTQTKNEKQALENSYAFMLIMEFCADLRLFFDDESVEAHKRKSKEQIQTYSLTEAEKNEIWEYAEKETKEALRQLGYADYTKKFGFCSAIRDVLNEENLTKDSQPTAQD